MKRYKMALGSIALVGLGAFAGYALRGLELHHPEKYGSSRTRLNDFASSNLITHGVVKSNFVEESGRQQPTINPHLQSNDVAIEVDPDKIWSPRYMQGVKFTFDPKGNLPEKVCSVLRLTSAQKQHAEKAFEQFRDAIKLQELAHLKISKTDQGKSLWEVGSFPSIREQLLGKLHSELFSILAQVRQFQKKKCCKSKA